MNAVHNDASAMHSPLPTTETVLPHVQEEQHASASTGVGERLDLPLRVMRELARRLASAFEAREARIRELQELIKNDAYHITAEQIADKMLQNVLQDELSGHRPARRTTP